MFNIRLLALAAAAAFVSCAGPIRYARTDTPAYSLSIWLEEAPLLDREDALKGCAEWLPKGVVCRPAESEETADVRVSVSDQECLADDDGYRTLAIAYQSGRIVFNSRCFR